MVIKDYVPVEFIIERVNRFPITGQTELNEESIKEWIAESIYEIGAHNSFVEATVTLQIEDGKCPLPPSLHSIQEVIETTHSVNLEDVGHGRFKPMSYKLSNGMIYTDFSEGELIMRYTSYPTDERGYPLILNEESYLKGVESYVLERIGFQAVLRGAMQSSVYDLLRRNRGYYIMAARNAAHYITRDRMANLQRVILNPYKDAIRRNRW